MNKRKKRNFILICDTGEYIMSYNDTSNLYTYDTTSKINLADSFSKKMCKRIQSRLQNINVKSNIVSPYISTNLVKCKLYFNDIYNLKYSFYNYEYNSMTVEHDILTFDIVDKLTFYDGDNKRYDFSRYINKYIYFNNEESLYKFLRKIYKTFSESILQPDISGISKNAILNITKLNILNKLDNNNNNNNNN